MDLYSERKQTESQGNPFKVEGKTLSKGIMTGPLDFGLFLLWLTSLDPFPSSQVYFWTIRKVSLSPSNIDPLIYDLVLDSINAAIPISSSYILPVHSVACSQWVTLVGIKQHPHLFFTGTFSLAYPDAGRLVQCLLYYLTPISFSSNPYHHQDTDHWDSWLELSECWSSRHIDETNTPHQFST